MVFRQSAIIKNLSHYLQIPLLVGGIYKIFGTDLCIFYIKFLEHN